MYRLPTEAEWEYACRAGTQTKWSFGDDIDELGHYAWYRGNTCFHNRCYSHVVGTKRPNPWGLYDMHGNVWEWVHDSYDKNYYERSPSVDPLGPPVDDPKKIECGISILKVPCYTRVIRGGSFIFGQYHRKLLNKPDPDPTFRDNYIWSADRSHYRPDYGNSEIGFRLVREEPIADEPPETDEPSGDGINIETIWFDPGDSLFGDLDDLISDINSPGNDTSGGTSGEPDLIVKYPRAEKSSSQGAIDIYATVINEGTGKSDETTLRYYNSNNKSIRSGASELQPSVSVSSPSVSVSSLDPGEEIDKMASFNSPGVWALYFGACVDAVDLESDTSNNCSDGVMIDDHGATRETATEVSPDTTLTGYLSTGDVDYFKVDIGFHLGDLTAETEGSTTYCRIENSNGASLAENDSGPITAGNVSLGAYYIKVKGPKKGNYTLHLSSKITKP